MTVDAASWQGYHFPSDSVRVHVPTKTEAEDILDWLDTHGVAGGWSQDEDGFTVHWDRPA